MIGVVTRKELHKLVREHAGEQSPLAAVIKKNPVVAYPDEPLRAVVYRMAEASLTRFPVVDRVQPQRLIGMVSLFRLARRASAQPGDAAASVYCACTFPLASHPDDAPGRGRNRQAG